MRSCVLPLLSAVLFLAQCCSMTEGWLAEIHRVLMFDFQPPTLARKIWFGRAVRATTRTPRTGYLPCSRCHQTTSPSQVCRHLCAFSRCFRSASERFRGADRARGRQPGRFSRRSAIRRSGALLNLPKLIVARRALWWTTAAAVPVCAVVCVFSQVLSQCDVSTSLARRAPHAKTR